MERVCRTARGGGGRGGVDPAVVTMGQHGPGDSRAAWSQAAVMVGRMSRCGSWAR
jgi:hypothetical protein